MAPYAGKRGILRKVWEELSMDTKRSIIAEALGIVTIKQTAHTVIVTRTRCEVSSVMRAIERRCAPAHSA